VDQRWIHNHISIQLEITSMVARQEEFNTRVNLLLSIEVGDLHDVQIMDLTISLIHGWGTILGFFLVIFVRYLCGVSIAYFFLPPRLKSLILMVGISPNCGPTARIPFGRYIMMSMYLKLRGMLSRLTTPSKGRM
jgi:hypothetical protein